MKFGTITHMSLLQLSDWQNLEFMKSKMAVAAIVQKLRYLSEWIFTMTVRPAFRDLLTFDDVIGILTCM